MLLQSRAVTEAAEKTLSPGVKRGFKCDQCGGDFTNQGLRYHIDHSVCLQDKPGRDAKAGDAGTPDTHLDSYTASKGAAAPASVATGLIDKPSTGLEGCAPEPESERPRSKAEHNELERARRNILKTYAPRPALLCASPPCMALPRASV